MTHRPASEFADTIATDDRGLSYGDGVFRTFRCTAGRPWDSQAQLRRLHADCAALALLAPPDDALLARIHADSHALGEAVVRVTVTRGSGPRGYRAPVAPACRALVQASAAQAPASWDSGYTLRVCELRLGMQPRLAGVKHLNRLENVLARAEWDDPAIDDGILLDSAGAVVETVIGNLFWRCGETICTPAIDRAGVAGVQRQRILDHLAERRVSLQIGHFPLDALLAADEVWVCNSVIGLRAVTRLQQRALTSGPLAADLAAQLFSGPRP